MDIFNYIGQEEPDQALSIFRKHSNQPISRDQIGDGLKYIYQGLQGNEDAKKEFLVDLAEIHPDAGLLSAVYGSEESDFDDNYTKKKCNCPHCSMSHENVHAVAANGQQAVNHYMSSGEVQTVVNSSTSGIAQEVHTMKVTTDLQNLMNDKIFKLVTLGVLAYLIYKITSK